MQNFKNSDFTTYCRLKNLHKKPYGEPMSNHCLYIKSAEVLKGPDCESLVFDITQDTLIKFW